MYLSIKIMQLVENLDIKIIELRYTKRTVEKLFVTAYSCEIMCDFLF